jgi:uncharacterized Zn finger protein
VGFPQAEQLRDALVEMLVASGDIVGAVAERREAFERHPLAVAYRALLAVVPEDQVAVVGEWAVAVLRARVGAQPGFATELVEVLLAAGELEAGWQVTVERLATLPESQAVRVLRLRQENHAGEVIGPYRMLVERHVLDARDKHRYRRAIALLPDLHAAYLASGDGQGFAAYVEQLRTEHRRRPAFLATLQAAGW